VLLLKPMSQYFISMRCGVRQRVYNLNTLRSL
jgi:hypothetical protein